MEEETSSRRGVFLRCFQNSPKKETRVSLLLSSLSPTKKKKRPLLVFLFSGCLFCGSVSARGNRRSLVSFNRTLRRAQRERVLRNDDGLWSEKL